MSHKNQSQAQATNKNAQNQNKASEAVIGKATGIGSLPPEQQVEAWFETHGLSEDQQNRAVAVRKAAKEFGLAILKNTKTSPDQTAGLRKLRECSLTLVQAISLEEVGA